MVHRKLVHRLKRPQTLCAHLLEVGIGHGGNQQVVGRAEHIHRHIVAVHIKHREAVGLYLMRVVHAAARQLPHRFILVCLPVLGFYLHLLACGFVAIGHIALHLEVLVGLHHAFAHLPVAEVDAGLVVDVVHLKADHHRYSRNQHNHVAFEASTVAQLLSHEYPHRRHIQHHVLPESLPVGELHRVAEAAAVGHLVGDGVDKRGDGEEKHHRRKQPRRKAAERTGDEQHAHHKLGTYQRHREEVSHRQCPLEGEAAYRPRRHILLHLEGRAQRVNAFAEAGEEEHQPHKPACYDVKGVIQFCVFHDRVKVEMVIKLKK